ncbi:NUDIX hydrolase [Corynebacterium propinquum]|uniref:NUDIX hydrolase n=2 Tax=Corynebacterium TaxID=1716 RepID=A0ABT7G1B0_9CORY|nr:NUDIX hydrolase [Corynebacterium propinquum]MCT1818845.1 NUDIX hydrolase [Corynebacterium propinquum]MDK4234817.1 NUDIX hydrolase [Corynebacterium propinquum]MDK4239228.1 NUDIX hydrolase [Corynebacterium propinquum]MDK4251915.1 NUDIX hydrolase [Corynebacterium propinquum]MDK4257648.1 NUDIX hydrolase [Corynebacterium propinquum]
MTNEEKSHKSRRRRRRRPAAQKGGHNPAGGNTDAAQNTDENSGKKRAQPAQKHHARKQGKQHSSKQQSSKQQSSKQHSSKQRTSKQASQQHPKHANKNAHPRRGHSSQRSVMETRTETSAGGLVLSGLAEAVAENGTVDLSSIYVALIGRLDRRGRLLWSMPKGHVEPDEEHTLTAEREVWEETGIHGEVFENLGVIDYWFVSDGVRIHKTVHHHLLRFVDGWLNDEDPEVTEVAWIPASELMERLAYADERKLARRAHDLLPELARAEKEAGRITPR